MPFLEQKQNHSFFKICQVRGLCTQESIRRNANNFDSRDFGQALNARSLVLVLPRTRTNRQHTHTHIQCWREGGVPRASDVSE